MAIWDDVTARFYGLPPLVQSAIVAAAVVLVGAVAIAILHSWLGKAFTRSRRIDRTVQDFLLAMFHVVAWALLGIAVLYVFGVSATLLAGLVAVGGFVVGFALKDSLSNIAAGVTLLIYRPFHVDDVVKVGDVIGKVTGLGLALTTVKTYDGQIATMSNAKVLGSTILNWTREPIRMADIEVGISYSDDIDAAVKAILDALQQDTRVLKDPAPDVRVRALADSSVNLHVRPWVATEHVFKAKADFLALVKAALEAAGCTIPFPQRDVHIHQDGGDGAGKGQEGAAH